MNLKVYSNEFVEEQAIKIQEDKFRFSEKSIDLIAYPSRIDIAEGTARSSKSTSMMFKFGLRVNASEYNQFFIAGNTKDVARRNLIDNKNGFMDMFKGHVRDGTNVAKYGTHLIFTDTKGRQKIIYIFGFKDKARWEKVLGATLGGGVIDEINTADPTFVKEVQRSIISVDNSWLGATLNPDNPDKDIYAELINKTRPLKKWVCDIPFEIIEELKRVKKSDVIPGGIYWHFNFNDNPIMNQEKIDYFKKLYPPGSFYYNSKILGIRGVAEGTIFGKYLTDDFFTKPIEIVYQAKKQLMSEIEYNFKTNKYIRYTIGIDLGNNEIKRGTILTFTGFREGFKGADPIDVCEAQSIETNDLVVEICNQIVEWYSMIIDKGRFAGVYIDGYGSVQLLIPTIRKKLISMGYSAIASKTDLCIKFGEDAGREARMMLLLLLIHQRKIQFNNTLGCKNLFKNLRKIVYDEDGLPLDENKIENDYYDSFCYSLTPFATKLNDEIVNFKLAT